MTDCITCMQVTDETFATFLRVLAKTDCTDQDLDALCPTDYRAVWAVVHRCRCSPGLGQETLQRSLSGFQTPIWQRMSRLLDNPRLAKIV